MRAIPIAVVLLLATLIGCDLHSKRSTQSPPIVTRIEASEVETAPPIEPGIQPVAPEFTGRVVSVTNGDTIDVLLADK